MNDKIAILILFFNKLEQTFDCINSFLPSGQNIYVLNNGSVATSWKRLQNNYSNIEQISFLDAGKNMGVSGGRNFLVQASKEQWILLIDNDICIRPVDEWKSRFQIFRLLNPAAKIICPSLYNVHEKSWASQLQINKKENLVFIETGDYSITNCFPGGAAFVHRSIFEKYGLFDEEMFVGFEDYEFALRAIMSGQEPLSAYHCKTIELIHHHQFQKTNKDKEAVRERYNVVKLKKSYNRLISKYNIVFEHDWEWWSKKQLEEMTGKNLLNKIKQGIKKIIDK